MPPVILTLLQALFLLLLYVFVGRAVRAIVRDLSPAGAASSLSRVRAARTATATRVRESAPRRQKAAPLDPTELVVQLPTGVTRVLALDDGLDGGGITFGRAPDVTVQIDDPYVSDRHARVYRVDTHWVLADLGSTNGTYHNTSKVTAPVRLVAGDQLAIGKTVVEARR